MSSRSSAKALLRESGQASCLSGEGPELRRESDFDELRRAFFERVASLRGEHDGVSRCIPLAREHLDSVEHEQQRELHVEQWTRQSEPLTGEELLSSGSYIRGFTKRAREYGDVELVPLTSPVGVFGGSSRSRNTKETFDHFVEQMILELEEAMPVDGVYLALHGAMAVREVPRPEAEIARRFREVVGPDVPIGGTFDLHGTATFRERGRRGLFASSPAASTRR